MMLLRERDARERTQLFEGGVQGGLRSGSLHCQPRYHPTDMDALNDTRMAWAVHERGEWKSCIRFLVDEVTFSNKALLLR